MHKLARLSGCDGASSDLSFAESFSRKRKADRSCLAILGEGKQMHIQYFCHLHFANHNSSYNSHMIISLMRTLDILPDDEDFNWEIPDGPSDEMEMSQSSVTVRSFEER